METYFKTTGLDVGYDGSVLIHNINLGIEKGKILTFIGPNGAGKSTILKSITGQLSALKGTVWIDQEEISKWSAKKMARKVAVALTEHTAPDLMTCSEVVATGRYPYTGLIGTFAKKDWEAVRSALECVHAEELADREFAVLSDGQKQRVLLARAICQETEVIVLDEPTAYLDLRHKIELLNLLRRMTREKQTTVIMSLHEIDLATKVSDSLVLVKENKIDAFGTPEELLQNGKMERLYEIQNGFFHSYFGSVELKKPEGEPRIFVAGGGGSGIPFYRLLQKKEIPFAAGILFEHDVEFQVANALSDYVISVPAFEPMREEHFEKASKQLLKCGTVLDCQPPEGSLNQMNRRLIQFAQQHQIPVVQKIEGEIRYEKDSTKSHDNGSAEWKR